MAGPAKAIAAYDVPERIARYDLDMDVMHPNRHPMADVVCRILPFDREEPFRALDLGIGTGFLTERILNAFPRATVVGIDGAAAMLDMARERLGNLSHRVSLRHGDFRTLPALLGSGHRVRLVISAYALHHLNREDKRSVVRACVEVLEPGGWFLNADNIVGNTPSLERRFQELRVAGILARAAGSFEDLTTSKEVRTFLDDLERTEGDQPLRLAEDLAILEEAGLEQVGALWLEMREAVTGGIKPAV